MPLSDRVIQCFLLEPTDRARESLRRYRSSGKGDPCPLPHGYHDASVAIGEIGLLIVEGARGYNGYGDDKHHHSDPQWPTACACGYVFGDGDEWQHNVDRLFRGSPGGQLVTLDEAAPGAMWYAPWYENVYKGPDGRCLVVKTPGGDWIVDSKASNGTPDNPGWTRTGEPPRVTARPSIGIGHGPNGGFRYHGFLTDGRLEEC